MDATAKPLEDLVQELPKDMRDEVRDFIEFLLAKQSRHSGKPLLQNWAGALREHRQQYTSLELQRKAMDWRGD